MQNLNIHIHDATIACKLWGNPENPAILAVHGWLDNANSFDYIAHYLQEHYYFIAIDLPGHGHSSHLGPNSHYHLIDAVFTLAAILNALELDKVHILGHSLGACLVSIAAGIIPERIHSLALIEGLGPLTHPADTSCKQLSKYAHYLSVERTNKNKGYHSRDDATYARAKRGHVSVEIAAHLCERGIIEEQGMFYWRHDKRLIAPSPLYLTEEQVLCCLQHITVKTCLFWASHGYSFNQELLEIRMKQIKELRLEYLEGGHHIHMEQPEAVARLLVDFYSRLN
ncbi:MAG: alpha/beta fold hydrolase [Legionella sp.]